MEDDKKKGGVKWDEDNLAYNEANQSATMKIDEPKTPYNREYVDEEEAEKKGGSKEGQSVAAKFSELSDALEASKGQKPKFIQIAEEAQKEDEEQQKKQEDFEKKRAQHYNEGHLLQKGRQLSEDEDD